ncbi:MAG: MotA/TolQ/ExbB proton channel family protein [Armatimonadetes bacterium]|nr:MotA/TolQ/ExbB proton channel family protein [Armatimonadota bacterium]
MSWFANAFEFLVKGGPVMVPLMGCSIISLAVMIERYLKIRGAASDTAGLGSHIQHLLHSGNSEQAIKKCQESNTAVGSVLAAGIQERHRPDQAERAMEERALVEASDMQARLGVLDTIITIAPLLGLLGTVTGMIRSFHVISSKSGIGTPTAITGGVAEALIATATGLAIAIVTLVGYNYLTEKVKRTIEAMEICATQLQKVLADLKERRNEIKAISA